MAAKKKSAKGKGAAKKKAAPKKKAAAKKAAPAKKKPASKAKPKPAPKPRPAAAKPAAAAHAPTKPVATPSPFPAPAPPPPPAEGEVTAHDVNRGHIFGLRPRANTAFSPQAFENARRELAEQRYATIEEAARAVAERALELTNQRPSREPFPST
jgi:hypothetical protein